MYYIGVHKGTPDDGYICSSKLMKEDYQNNPTHFTREIIASGEYKEMRTKEMLMLAEVDAARNPLYYNQSNGNQEFYCKGHTKEAREKIGLASVGNQHNSGKKATNETKRKLSTAHMGHLTSEETRKKISMANKGRNTSSETRLKMSIAKKGKPSWNKGIKATDEHKKKLSISHIGKKHTEEQKLKISLANSNRVWSQESKNKIWETRRRKELERFYDRS